MNKTSKLIIFEKTLTLQASFMSVGAYTFLMNVPMRSLLLHAFGV